MRTEPGCLTRDVSPSDDPMMWEVMQAFRSRADFDAQQIRTRSSAWFAAIRDILRDFRVGELGSWGVGGLRGNLSRRNVPRSSTLTGFIAAQRRTPAWE